MSEIDRRSFLKIMGITGGGVVATLSGCSSDVGVSIEDGVETVASYVDPQDFAIPGQEVWYASTCNQCPAGCGIHARVMEGRVKKLEGNPASPINQGALCASGQAGLENHYHPDRLQKPLMRENGNKDGKLVEITWDEANKKLVDIVARVHEKKGAGFAVLSGEMSGHLGGLMTAWVKAVGGGNGSVKHFSYELLAQAGARAANKQTSGVAAPLYDFDKARLIVSFGADFLGTWQSPVHFSGQYSKFRDHPRGALIQIEPKMSLTGSNADWWLPIRAGSEGWLMLGVAHLLLKDPKIAARLAQASVGKILSAHDLDAYDLKNVSRETGIAPDQIERLARALQKRSPSLVLVGGTAEAHEQGQRAVLAGWLLNHLLGNVGQTLTANPSVQETEFTNMPGSTRALREFADALPKIDTVFIHGANPLYTAADFFGLKEKMHKVGTKVVFASHPDETTMAADLVIPVRSNLEEWGTRIPAYNPDPGTVHLQQPVMQPLFADVPGFGDLLLGFMRQKEERYAQWNDFYSYLRASIESLRGRAEATGTKPYKLPGLLEPPALLPESPEHVFPVSEIDRAFWEAVVARGLLNLPTKAAPALKVALSPVALKSIAADAEYPFDFIPSPRVGLYDGRHANLPWLQELPDQLTTIVWDSWAEIHPETAAKLGITSGDFVEIASAQGKFEVMAVLFPGIHPDAVAVPMGQGHEVGHYAKGIGVNPLKILAPKFDIDSGELALYATRVKIRRIGRRDLVVKQAPTHYQHNRRIVRTVSARKFDKAKEG